MICLNDDVIFSHGSDHVVRHGRPQHWDWWVRSSYYNYTRHACLKHGTMPIIQDKASVSGYCPILKHWNGNKSLYFNFANYLSNSRIHEIQKQWQEEAWVQLYIKLFVKLPYFCNHIEIQNFAAILLYIFFGNSFFKDIPIITPNPRLFMILTVYLYTLIFS